MSQDIRGTLQGKCRLESAMTPISPIPEDFNSWWIRDGRMYDPDTEDVPWFDKRHDLAQYVWDAAKKSVSLPEIDRLINKLRDERNAAEERIAKLTAEVERLKAALNRVWEVASGESQVAMDDTQGMEYLSDYVSAVTGRQGGRK